jgi:hypothetical protein
MTTMCLHCGFKMGDVSDEQLEIFARRKLRDHIYHLKMSSYVVITLFLVAFGWYWVETQDFQHAPGNGPIFLISVCVVAYLVVRVMMYRARAARRKMNSD